MNYVLFDPVQKLPNLVPIPNMAPIMATDVFLSHIGLNQK